MFLTVDLASKFSAAMLRDSEGQVRWQGDSFNLSPKEWVKRLGQVARTSNPEHILVEDVPYGISSQAMTKPVTRLQGMLMLELDRDFYFINPATWQKEYPGVGRAPKGMTKTEASKYRIEKAIEFALQLGYEPPNLVQQYIDSLPEGSKILKKFTNPLEKNMTDYVDARLMNDWLERHVDDYTTISGVQLSMI